MERFSYRENEQRFRAACDWLTGLGVRIDATRVAQYSRDLANIAEHHEAGTIDNLLAEEGFATLVNALIEASEFVDIYAGLGERSDPEMVMRLKSFVGGAVMLVEETPEHSRSRNIGFELLLAALAARCNLPVSLEPPADISILLESGPLAIECKRPYSPRKIENRVSKGLQQLVRRYDASKNPSTARGILALSITRTETRGFKVLEGDNESEIRAKIEDVFSGFVQRHKRHWETRADGRTLAVLLELRPPCFIKDPSIIAIPIEHAFVPLCDPNSEDRELLNQVVRAFSTLKTPL